MQPFSHSAIHVLLLVSSVVAPVACLEPPPRPQGGDPSGQLASDVEPRPAETFQEVDSWAAARDMGPGVNIGNTFDNTSQWEVGWGNPRVTREYVQALKQLGFKSVRLPVAWDTYAVGGQIQADKFNRIAEVVDWITGEGMYCIINIHWDGGWIDSSWKEHYTDTFATFSPVAEKKYRSYWRQIAEFFAGKSEKLVFEALNEETNFDNEGSSQKAYATLTRVQQIFIDVVRGTGGNNAKRLLIVAGYHTDIKKTCDPEYTLPVDTVPHRMFISVHYYTPYQFCGLAEDADWGKMMPTWGTAPDVAQLNQLFDMMARFTERNDIPAYIGEFGVMKEKESASRIRWMSSVMQASLQRKMVPVLWDTGGDISRRPPYTPSAELQQVLLPP
jgi:endoglucanase